MKLFYPLIFVLGLTSAFAQEDIPFAMPSVDAVAQPQGEEPSGQFVDKVTLGALDKVTARVSQLTVKVNESVQYGPLAIKVKKCWQASPENTPETKAFLEITETKPNKPAVKIFKGWMFASNPSVTTLEHPVYDVWVIQEATEPSAEGQAKATDEASQKLDKLLGDLLELPKD